MRRFLLIGNSGSGKSTLAKQLAAHGLAHLDLDTVAWTGAVPPCRRAVEESAKDLDAFMAANDSWVIEGCYADLAEVVARRATTLLFLNPGVEACIANARRRPWEPHKYASKEEQDAGLDFLLGWIRQYDARSDEFGLGSHRRVFERFEGEKVELMSLESISAFEGSQAPRPG